MARRKITEEAKQQAEEDQERSDQESSSDDSSSSSDGSDREQLTQRMPTDLVDDVDDFADEMGLSRNAAINFIVRAWMKENH